MNKKVAEVLTIAIITYTVGSVAIWLFKHTPARTSLRHVKMIRQTKPVAIRKLKPSCDDTGKCEGRYAMTDGDSWFIYNYGFQGTDSTSARSIPTSGWERGSKPNEEELDESQNETDTEMTFESEASDSSDAGTADSSDSGGDGGGGDGGGD